MGGEDPKDPDMEYIGLMPVAPVNPPGGLVVAAPTLVTIAPTPIAIAPTPAAPTPAAAATVSANRGVCAANQGAQRAQANIVAGNIGDPQVFPSGVRTNRNNDQISLLAQMNQEVSRSIANLNSFLPCEDERCQARLKAALTRANQRLSAAIVHGRPTTTLLQQIKRLEYQLDAILNII